MAESQYDSGGGGAGFTVKNLLPEWNFRRELRPVSKVKRRMTRFLSRCVVWAAAVAAPVLLRADEPRDFALLKEAIAKWEAGKQDLAFTQRGRTLTDDGQVKEERLERYDPSLPDAQRWHLIEVNGKPPTEEQRNAIELRRNRKPRKKALKPPEEMLDLPRTVVAAETAKDVTFEVPLRPAAARLFQTEKLILLITVGRESHSLERVTATLREPMRVALGLARITDVDFDITTDAADDRKPETKGEGGKDQISGTARVALTKLGERMEYEWWEFKRVDPYRGGRTADARTSGSAGSSER
jgi:hypothetical protein